MKTKVSKPKAVSIQPEQAKFNPSKLTTENIVALVLPRLKDILAINRDITAQEFKEAVCRACNGTVRDIRERRNENRLIEKKVKLTAYTFGVLTQGSVVLGRSLDKTLDYFLNESDCLMEWSNNGYKMPLGCR